MYLQQLSVINFKNYAEAGLTFSEGVNVFTGNNGAGKTNLLDAIHYLSLCKSYFILNRVENMPLVDEMETLSYKETSQGLTKTDIDDTTDKAGHWFFYRHR